ncbi:FAD binding domain-containing protein [Sarocladium implicatum]|nr:FAD binding domain-containing protein [Sarocladium implicatum]
MNTPPTLPRPIYAQKLFPTCIWSCMKVIPGDDCWPSGETWEAFNDAIDGSLVKTQPVAQSCYSPDKDLKQCAVVNKMWSDQDFQTAKSIGRVYPYNITCAPVDYEAGAEPTSCILGSLPVYAVNVTKKEHISESLEFAKDHNIRLAVSGTGHDLLGRGDGFGSLEIWLRYYRNSINFQETFESATSCTKSGWKGSAIDIDGVWQWRDVYKIAKANNVIVVGGGSTGPGAIGGWASGGGHGPATRNYGLGADQILEAQVMLANGDIVTANHCENVDLFRAMRGGGPGYGITLSATVKAYPNVDVVTVHKLAFAPLNETPENEDLLDAVAVLLRALPDLGDAGYAGYGYWFREFPGPFIGDAHSGYTHGFWTIGKDQAAAEEAWAPVMGKLSEFQDKLFISSTFSTYDDYWSFYDAESGLYDPAGDTAILTSRLINRSALSDSDKLRDTITTISGEPGQVVSNVILLVSGGQVFKDKEDTTSGLLPAWRDSHFAIVSGSGLASKTATLEERKQANDATTYVRGAALKELAPNTGGYVNEGDRHDPEWIKTFYGSQYLKHLETKDKYDPERLFYCPTCVGSEAFVDRPDGPLCRV